MASIHRAMSLEPGSEFTLNGRSAIVSEALGDKLLIQWREGVDPATGEIFQTCVDLMPCLKVARYLESGQLNIIRVPSQQSDPARTQRVVEALCDDSDRQSRVLFRKDVVDAVDALIDEGTLTPQPTRKEIGQVIDQIVGRTTLAQNRRNSGGKKGSRGGTAIRTRRPLTSARSVHDLWRKFKKDPQLGLYDNYPRSGRRNSRYTAEEIGFYSDVLEKRITLERPHLASLLRSVQAAVKVENHERKKLSPPKGPLQVPGRDYVRKLVLRVSPVDYAIRTRGREAAYRDLHSLGRGVETSRPMERVEIDEQTTDLVVLLNGVGATLDESIRQYLDFDLDSTRVICSTAIDCYTDCIVGLQISGRSSVDLTMRTIEMIYLDKTEFARAAGAMSDWDMFGHPEQVVMDKGAAYISDEVYYKFSAAGITNISLPGESPYLKPRIERFFGTLSTGLMTHLVGRTFSNVVEKGDNDPHARARISLDDFLRYLTRWIVDVHHNTPTGRDGLTPRQMWQRALLETPPIARASESRQRMTFGSRHKRRITRNGVQISNLFYQSEELASWFLSDHNRDVEVWWWARKVGRVEVRLPDGRLLTVPCTDQRWLSASYDQVRAHYESLTEPDPAGELARARAITDIDNEIASLSLSSGLLPVAPDERKLKEDERRHLRFMKSLDRPEPDRRPLFGDVVEPDSSSDLDESDRLRSDPSGHSETNEELGPRDPDDYDDIME